MNILEGIRFGLANGAEEFIIHHYSYNGQRYSQTPKSVFSYVRGYEDCEIVNFHISTASRFYNQRLNSYECSKREKSLCEISYRLPDESLTD